MNTSVTVRGKKIDVQFQQHKINIINNNELFTLITNEHEDANAELVALIKTEFNRVYNKEFKVSDASMMIEIWGHVYAEKFAEAIKNFSSVKLVNAITDKILEHADIIDIGEKGYYGNRIVLDGLAPFKHAVEFVLFAKQKQDH